MPASLKKLSIAQFARVENCKSCIKYQENVGITPQSYKNILWHNVEAHGPPGWLLVVVLPIPKWLTKAAFPTSRTGVINQRTAKPFSQAD
jgi:hypothetical protein